MSQESTLLPSTSFESRPVASPCIGRCRLDAAGRYCLGCLRDLDEIATWASASESRRRDILAALVARREARK